MGKSSEINPDIIKGEPVCLGNKGCPKYSYVPMSAESGLCDEKYEVEKGSPCILGLQRQRSQYLDELLVAAEFIAAYSGHCPRSMFPDWDHPKGGCKEECKRAYYPGCWIDYLRDIGKYASQTEARKARVKNKGPFNGM